MDFFKDIIIKPISIVWLFLTGGVSLVAGFADLGEMASALKLLGAISLSAILAVMVLVFQSHGYYKRSRSPAKIRNVIEGTHHYSGNLVIIFDKSPWISVGQVLMLVQEANDVQLPIALVGIETTTTKGFPQAVILNSLSPENIVVYLSDSSRWNSIVGLPDIKYKYIAGVGDA